MKSSRRTVSIAVRSRSERRSPRRPSSPILASRSRRRSSSPLIGWRGGGMTHPLVIGPFSLGRVQHEFHRPRARLPVEMWSSPAAVCATSSPTLPGVARPACSAVVLTALVAAAGCDLGSDEERVSTERPREAESHGDSGPAPLVDGLRRGGYVLAFRHAVTDFSMADSTRDLSDCSRQRNLTAEGRRQARSIGREFRRLGIPVGRVLASPFCRTRETATLAFGRAVPSRALLSAEFFDDERAGERQPARLRQLLASPPRGKVGGVSRSSLAARRASGRRWGELPPACRG